MRGGLALLFAVHIGVGLWAWLSRRHLNGLLGGYGKGCWAESSSYMMDARESLEKSIMWIVILLVIDFLVIYGVFS